MDSINSLLLFVMVLLLSIFLISISSVLSNLKLIKSRLTTLSLYGRVITFAPTKVRITVSASFKRIMKRHHLIASFALTHETIDLTMGGMIAIEGFKLLMILNVLVVMFQRNDYKYSGSTYSYFVGVALAIGFFISLPLSEVFAYLIRRQIPYVKRIAAKSQLLETSKADVDVSGQFPILVDGMEVTSFISAVSVADKRVPLMSARARLMKMIPTEDQVEESSAASQSAIEMLVPLGLGLIGIILTAYSMHLLVYGKENSDVSQFIISYLLIAEAFDLLLIRPLLAAIMTVSPMPCESDILLGEEKELGRILGIRVD